MPCLPMLFYASKNLRCSWQRLHGGGKARLTCDLALVDVHFCPPHVFYGAAFTAFVLWAACDPLRDGANVTATVRVEAIARDELKRGVPVAYQGSRYRGRGTVPASA